MKRAIVAAMLLALQLAGEGPALAHEYELGALTVVHPWSRPTAPGVPVAAGYLTIVNGGTQADALVGASSPRAARIELHQSSFEGGVMRMRPVARIEIPPRATVRLGPNGLHLMMQGLAAPFTNGARVPAVLRFERAGELSVVFRVETPAERGGPQAGPHVHGDTP